MAKKATAPAKPAPKPAAAPVLFAPAGAPPHEPAAVDLNEYSGKYKMLGAPKDEEPYGLKIVKDDPLGRTHKLKNKVHFWEGNEAEFRQHFEKV